VVLYVTVQGPDRHPGRPDQGSEQGFVGVDLGLTVAVVAARADGTEVTRLAPLGPLQRSLTALRRADRTAARRQKGSNNRRKAHDRLGVIHARVANQRKDFLHRSSSTLVKTHDRLCLEDLAVRNMVANRHLARRIADAGSKAPDPEARGRVTNACGGTSAGHRLGGGGTGPATAGEARAKKQEPALLGDRA
jgi:transposase